MRATVWMLIGLSILCAEPAVAAVDCSAARKAQAAPAQALQLSPIADELAAPSAQLGAGVGFAKLLDDGVTVDRVLARAQHLQCVASAAPAAGGGLATPGAYQPKTANDNTPWRFDMTQNGKRMTADEFDAWMKARGVRVVQGPAKPAAPAAPKPAEPAEPPKKKKR